MRGKILMEAEAVNGDPSAAKVVPGSRKYLKLAEAGYIAGFALSLANLVALAFVFDSFNMNSLWSEVAEAVLSLVLSVAWIQIGRKQGISLFIAAGALGWVDPVIGLVLRPESGPNLSGSGFALALAQSESIVALIYFAVQLLAFNTAANTFKVAPFRYATRLLAAGFLAPILLGVALAVAQSLGHDWGPNLVYGLGLGFSAATALAAGIGFRRLGSFLPTGGNSG